MLHVGQKCDRFLGTSVRNVEAKFIELDELWGFVYVVKRCGLLLLIFRERRTMMIRVPSNQQAFYREWLMTRGRFDPVQFGVNMERDAFMDLVVEDFNAIYRDRLTIDELLLHPREALLFCDDVRRKHCFLDVPDDIILRSVLTRRKNP